MQFLPSFSKNKNAGNDITDIGFVSVGVFLSSSFFFFANPTSVNKLQSNSPLDLQRHCGSSTQMNQCCMPM